MKIRSLIISICLLATMLGAMAVERQTAGVRLGMRPREVFDLLGDPTAILMAQPPIGGAPAGMREPGMPGMAPASAPPQGNNTLVFLYKNQEIELTTETAVATGTQVTGNAIPLWAYTVRVARLALDQQQLIYRINDTYSLGIIISGEGNEARVTDIIACSLKPLTFWPNDPKREFDRQNVFFKDMFTYKYSPSGAKRELPAGTSKKVTIGSRLSDVLKAHKWPEFFIPFTTEAAAMMQLDPKRPQPVVNAAQGGQSPGGSANFAFGSSDTLQANFANNCIMLYPEDGLALTLMNHIVVRIQIGKEMTRPSMVDFVPGGPGKTGARQ